MYAKTGKFDFSRFIGSGGMPSSHSAFVVSLAVAVGLDCGYDTAQFAICFAFAVVTMYDASGVRRAAGEHAKVLNQIVEQLFDPESDQAAAQNKLKELLGHSPAEVLAGALLGVVVAVVMNFIL